MPVCSIISSFNQASNLDFYIQPWKTQPFNANQTTDNLSSWTSGSVVSPTAHNVVLGSKVYSFDAGYVNYSWSAITKVANIDNNGNIGSWSSINVGATAFKNPFPLLTKTKLYLIGGTDQSTSERSEIYVASHSNGTLGNFASAGNLPGTYIDGVGARSAAYIYKYSHIVQVGKFIYLFCGSGYPWTWRSTITNGVLSSWTRVYPAVGQYDTGYCFATSTRIYHFSGTTLQYATVAADGSLSGWQTAFTVPFSAVQCFAITKYRVWCFGAGSNLIYSAPISEAGVVGAFTQSTTKLPVSSGCFSDPIITNTRLSIPGGEGQGTGIWTSFEGGANDYSAYL
jgi:hypothetical protein